MRSIAPVLLAVSLAACHRTAEEPAARAEPSVTRLESGTPVGSGSGGKGAGDASLAGRCVVPTPDTPPPPVPPGPAPDCPGDPDPRPPLPTAAIRMDEAAHGALRLEVEIARSEEETERGLMYRKSMPEEHGMLFAFDGEPRHVHTFWMRNTCIPLDMLFLDDDGLIVGVLENVPTLNTAMRSVPCASSYVLEVNAGWSRRHGVRAGQRVTLPVM
jgi:uncharacterized membrane protein (UPF0127 family)